LWGRIEAAIAWTALEELNTSIGGRLQAFSSENARPY